MGPAEVRGQLPGRPRTAVRGDGLVAVGRMLGSWVGLGERSFSESFLLIITGCLCDILVTLSVYVPPNSS